jgi:hypothetical protein
VREWAAILVALAACDRSPSVASCAEHLGGVWATDDGSGRWHIRDGGKTLEAYPLVRELPAAAAGTLPAPSMIDLRRQGDEVAGTVVRRWHRGAQTCLMRAPARVRGCRDDRMTLTVGDTGAPVDWHACAAPESAPATQLLRRVWP